MVWSELFIAVATFAGTAVQTVNSTRDLSRLGTQVQDAMAVEDLRTEFSIIRRPRQWFRRQREIHRLLNPKDPPSEPDAYISELKAMYGQIWLHIAGWALLMSAAAGATSMAIFGS